MCEYRCVTVAIVKLEAHTMQLDLLQLISWTIHYHGLRFAGEQMILLLSGTSNAEMRFCSFRVKHELTLEL